VRIRDHPIHGGPGYRGAEYPEPNYFPYPATTQHGGTVSKTIDARIADSWLRRAGVKTPPSPSEAGEESRSTAASVPGEVREGWDPWETWLTQIDQPRRSRARNVKNLVSKTLDTLGLK
jgi:hypothetical protein